MVIFSLALLTLPLLLQPSLNSALALPQSNVALRLSQQVGGKDGAPMVLIPAGEFTMGNDEAAPDERPAHRVYLEAFSIDRYEVTVARYAKFLESEDHDPPFLWHDAKQGHHGTKPVVGVDWYDAAAYCHWAGKRLPSEAEWEKAARGTDGRLYPWGNDSPSRIHANFEQESKKGYVALTPVGSFERGKSPYGVYDMAGNVWEWVGDRYGEHYYQNSPERDPSGPPAGPLRVLRGGAWNSGPHVLASANRNAYLPSGRRSDVGFRCAHTAPKESRLSPAYSFLILASHELSWLTMILRCWERAASWRRRGGRV